MSILKTSTKEKSKEERMLLSNPSTLSEITNQTTIDSNKKMSILQDMQNPHLKIFIKTKIMQHLN